MPSPAPANLKAQGLTGQKASSALADSLKQRILSRELPEGSRLPSERHLCEQTGLSRTAVREALQMLDLQGLILTKPGRGGGSSVRPRSDEMVQQSVDLFIRGQQIKVESVVEVRELLEPIAARLAAERRSDRDLVELGRYHANLETSLTAPDDFLQANVDWHLAVARASGNKLLAALLAAVSQPIHEETHNRLFDTDEVRTMTMRAHVSIMNAIVARDGVAAERRMIRHVSAYADFVSKIKEQSGPRRKPRSAATSATGGRKRALSSNSD